jgi:hypothetical protein
MECTGGAIGKFMKTLKLARLKGATASRIREDCDEKCGRFWPGL